MPSANMRHFKLPFIGPARPLPRPLLIVAAVLVLSLIAWIPVVCWFLGNRTPTSASVTLADFTDPATHGWHSIPQGEYACNGVTFVCNGALRTSGLRAARDGGRYPGAVFDVPVHRRGARIHLPQAAENSRGAFVGAPYGRVILHYANGQTRRFDLLFGVHGRDWMLNPRQADQPVLDENTKVG